MNAQTPTYQCAFTHRLYAAPLLPAQLTRLTSCYFKEVSSTVSDAFYDRQPEYWLYHPSILVLSLPDRWVHQMLLTDYTGLMPPYRYH